MIANYHTHTYRCHHATGTEREYIERAIANGIKYMGFSDHSPFIFPNGYESKYRVRLVEAEDYMNDLRKLKDEYKDQIDIKIGFEMEYFPLYFDQMYNFVRDIGAEYLILGQHCIKNRQDGEASFASVDSDSVEKLETYVKEACEGMETGVFSYLCHPDVINFTGERDIYLREMRKICETSLKTGVPLELNFLGIRCKRHYPNMDFWKMVGEMGCDTVYGFDAHDAEAAYDGESLIAAEQIREKYGLRVLQVPKIIDIQKIQVK